MAEYKDFELTDSQIDRLKHFNAHKSIVKYIRENGEEPSNPDEFFTVTEEDLERMKRCMYAKELCEECSAEPTSETTIVE